MNAREEVLARLRVARDAGAPRAAPGPVPREYARRGAHDPGSPGALALLVERVEDYRATVTQVAAARDVPAVVAALLAEAWSVVVPPGVDRAWLDACTADVVVDGEPRPRAAADIDVVGAVLTGSAVAVAETGTFVLDAAADDQGRRLLTLVPDHHVCVVRAEDVVGTVPEALARLDPLHPLTFVSGLSATSDIEPDRVEGSTVPAGWTSCSWGEDRPGHRLRPRSPRRRPRRPSPDRRAGGGRARGT